MVVWLRFHIREIAPKIIMINTNKVYSLVFIFAFVLPITITYVVEI